MNNLTLQTVFPVYPVLNQHFSSQAELYRFVFGKPWPSSRSKNIALAKEELNRYVSYCPVHEIDPTEKRKKPVVITELHNPPLPARETQRRRHGTYIDLLRPLLLSQQSYDRKMYALFNKLGLFSAYYDELKIRPEANGLIQKGKEDDVNIWRPQFHPQIGEKHYAYLLTRTMKEALKTEDYEMAAVCRDKIRALKAGKDGQVHE